jgi:sugar phosphate isomerase/epimerase
MMKYSFCNEPFKEIPFQDACRILADIGYDGIELAPFTFHEDIRALDSAARTEIRKTAENVGLEVVGIHWLLVSPKGFHLTTEDAAIRAQTLEFMKELLRFCKDVGGKVLIHGSPQQRNLEPTQDRAAVEERTVEIFRQVGEEAEKLGVTFCLEALDKAQTNFINTPGEAYQMVRRVDRPGFQMMLDARASFADGMDPAQELRACISAIKHVHLNDTNLLGPGMGEHDFEPLFQAGRDTGFEAFYSVEPFDYSPGPENIARESFNTIRTLHDKVFGS